MQFRWFAFLALIGLGIAFAASVSAHPIETPNSNAPTLLRRCEDNYDDEEIEAMRADGEDGYEPDDCPLLAHTLTGPMLLNFCQPGDEDWIKFKARPNLLYQIRAEPQWNYPTEPRMELYVDGELVAQNDHYFDRHAEIWWWNSSTARVVYVRLIELGGRHECGNNAYTLTLNAFTENPYPQTPLPTVTPTFTPTLVITPTLFATTTPTATLAPSK